MSVTSPTIEAAPAVQPRVARILCTDLAGLRAQALGLAEAACLRPAFHALQPRFPWSRLSPSLWPRPLAAVQQAAITPPFGDVLIGAGGAAARVCAALRSPALPAVIIQHPRMALSKFDLVLAARHDGISGPNVIVTRTALHRVTPARLDAERAIWAPVFAALPRPLVAVLIGGSNGRYRLETDFAAHLAEQLAGLIKSGQAGIMLTPSRRTAPAVLEILRGRLAPLGAYVWDMQGENPYFGMLACADAIIATADSVSMVSEAVATAVPVYLLRLPGRSARIGAFMDALVADGRVRDFTGRLDMWPVEPMDDTPMAGFELRRRLGFQ